MKGNKLNTIVIITQNTIMSSYIEHLFFKNIDLHNIIRYNTINNLFADSIKGGHKLNAMSRSKKSKRKTPEEILASPDYRVPKVSAKRSIKNIKDIATSNPWDYFCTLTFPDYINEKYEYTQERARAFKKDIENAGGQILMIIGIGKESGRYHVHALLHNVAPDMIIPGSSNSGLIRVKTDGTLWSLSEPEKYDVGLHVIQEIRNKDDYNHIADYMAGHIPDMRTHMYELYALGGCDTTPHMYYATRKLNRTIRAWIREMATDNKDMINAVYKEEMDKAFEPGIFDSEYYAAWHRVQKRITHKINIFCNHGQGAAVTMPEEVAHMITDVTIPDTVETYKRCGKRWCRFTGELKQLVDALYLSHIPSGLGWDNCSANIAYYFS